MFAVSGWDIGSSHAWSEVEKGEPKEYEAEIQVWADNEGRLETSER